LLAAVAVDFAHVILVDWEPTVAALTYHSPFVYVIETIVQTTPATATPAIPRQKSVEWKLLRCLPRPRSFLPDYVSCVVKFQNLVSCTLGSVRKKCRYNVV